MQHRIVFEAIVGNISNQCFEDLTTVLHLSFPDKFLL